MSCNTCKSREAVEQQHYIDVVSGLAERTIKRLWIALIMTIILLVGTNIAWVVYENQFEDIVVTQENADGYNNYIGNDGDIHNGETND